MKIEASTGEIVDKLSILHIKKNKIKDNTKLINVLKEYEYLYHMVFIELKIELKDYTELLVVNNELWEVEDDIRLKENSNEFDEEFIKIARRVYTLNDKRYKIKNEINIKYSSNFKEEKSYN